MGEPTADEKLLALELLKVLLTRPLARLFWRRSVRKAFLLAGYYNNFGK